MISIVLPFAARRMSPGRNASPPGRFSAAARTAIARTGSAERGERADPVQRPGAAGHVALHVLHPAGRLDRDAAGVERDRLADEPEHDVVARAGRVVAEDDQARLVAAAAADRGRARPCRARRAPGSEHLARSGARARRASSCAFSPSVCGRELVRRHVREVARAVRPVGDDRGPLDGLPAAPSRRRGRRRSAPVRVASSFDFQRPGE